MVILVRSLMFMDVVHGLVFIVVDVIEVAQQVFSLVELSAICNELVVVIYYTIKKKPLLAGPTIGNEPEVTLSYLL
jgi:hypothetical protein